MLGSCGVSVAPFCRLEILSTLPCRVFTCGFLWFRGPCSWCFLGLYTGVLSSRFWWLRLAQGGCCLHFVWGPLPMAGAVFFGIRYSWWLSLLLSGCPCAFALGSSSVGLVCVRASPVSSYVFLWDVVTLWVNSVFLSLLIAIEGLHWWLFLSDFANPFWGRVVVFLRPLSVCRHVLWLVVALLSGLSLTSASGLSSPGLSCYLAMCLWFADWLSLWSCIHSLLGFRISWPSCLSLALQLALVLQVPVSSLLPYGSHPSQWGHPCGVEDGLSSIGTKVSCFSLSLLGLFLHVVTARGVLVTIWVSVLVGSLLCATDGFRWC